MNALGDVIRRLVQVLRSRSRVKAGSAVLIVRGGIHVLGRGIGRAAVGQAAGWAPIDTARAAVGKDAGQVVTTVNFLAATSTCSYQLRSRPQRNHRKTTGLQPLRQR